MDKEISKLDEMETKEVSGGKQVGKNRRISNKKIRIYHLAYGSPMVHANPIFKPKMYNGPEVKGEPKNKENIKENSEK